MAEDAGPVPIEPLPIARPKATIGIPFPPKEGAKGIFRPNTRDRSRPKDYQPRLNFTKVFTKCQG